MPMRQHRELLMQNSRAQRRLRACWHVMRACAAQRVASLRRTCAAREYDYVTILSRRMRYAARETRRRSMRRDESSDISGVAALLQARQCAAARCLLRRRLI